MANTFEPPSAQTQEKRWTQQQSGTKSVEKKKKGVHRTSKAWEFTSSQQQQKQKKTWENIKRGVHRNKKSVELHGNTKDGSSQQQTEKTKKKNGGK